MKRPLKISLLVLTGVAVVGVVLWMRSLASWRPVKLGKIPASSTALTSEDGSYISISTDGRYLVRNENETFRRYDLKTGKTISWPPLAPAMYSYGFAPPFIVDRTLWHYDTFAGKKKHALTLRDMVSGERKFEYHIDQPTPTVFVKVDETGKLLRLVDGPFFKEIELSSGRVLRKTKLKGTFPTYASSSSNPEGTFSRDGKKAFQYMAGLGRVWDNHSGELLASWSATTRFKRTLPDERFVAFTPANNTGELHILDSMTGKVLWKTPPLNFGHSFSDAGDELLLFKRTGCEVHSVATGKLLRHLPGPRGVDGEVIRVTHDWIYVLSAKNDIYRWRAR